MGKTKAKKQLIMMTPETRVDKILSKIYYDLSDNASLSGLIQLKREVKKRKLNISVSEIEKWLKKQEAYTLHKQRKLRFPRLKYNILNIDDVWAIDLMDMQNITRFNYKQRYILAVIDQFSRFAWCIPITNKTSTSVIKAFEKLFKKTKRRPLNILSDQGKEFVSKHVKKFLSDHSINFYTANDPATKASMCERFIRSIKSLIYKYFTNKNTKKYVDVLDRLVNIYNNRKHRSIGRAPIEVNETNILEVWKYMNKHTPRKIFNEQKPKLSVGKLVRISNPKKLFDKGYTKQWSNDIFLVKKVILSYPHTYRISSLDGEEIKSLFYEQELQEVLIK